MKFSALTFVALFVHQVSCNFELFNVSYTQNFVSNAINGILEEFFVKTVSKIDLVYVTNNGRKTSEKVVDIILKNSNNSFGFKVSKYENFNYPLSLNASSIFIFDIFEDFRQLCNNIAWQTNPAILHKHLVYIEGATSSNLENIKNITSIDSNVNFLLQETEKSIQLVTSFTFTSEACEKNQLKSINRFTTKSTKWEVSNFYPQKYQHFHGCTLMIDQSGNGMLQDISEVFAKSVNATPMYSSSKVLIISPRTDIGHLRVRSMSLLIMSRLNRIPGHFFAFDKLVFFIPPGELYTTLEKMLAPFEAEV